MVNTDLMENEWRAMLTSFRLLKVGVRRMLSLVWSSESDVKAAVVQAYKRLYMTMEDSSKKKAVQVVTNLTALISCSTQGELASLEELVSLCVKTGDLPKACIQVT